MSAVDSNPMRSTFERWYSDAGASPRAIERDRSGGYLLAQADAAWNAWQAAWGARTAQPRTDAAQQGEVVAWKDSEGVLWSSMDDVPGQYLPPVRAFTPLYTAPPSAPAPVAGDAAEVIEEMRSRMSSRGRVGDGPVYGGDLIDWANRLEAALAQDRASQAAAPSAPVGVEGAWLPGASAPEDTMVICAWLGAPGCSEVDVAVLHTEHADTPYWCSPHDAQQRFSQPDLWQPFPALSLEALEALAEQTAPVAPTGAVPMTADDPRNPFTYPPIAQAWSNGYNAALAQDRASQAAAPSAPVGVDEAAEDAAAIDKAWGRFNAALAQQPAAVDEDDAEPAEPCESGLPDCGPAVAWDCEGVGVCERCAKELGWVAGQQQGGRTNG